MPSVSDDFADAFFALAVDLARVEESLRADVVLLLEKLRDDLVRQIVRADLAGMTRESFRLRRAEVLLEQVRETIATAYTGVNVELRDQLIELAEIQRDTIKKIVGKVLEANLVTTALTRSTLRALVRDDIVLGGPAKDWWSKQSDDLAMRFATQIRLGVAQGETNDQLVQRIRGKATGRRFKIKSHGKTTTVREYTGGVMDVSIRDATALVRTSVQNVSNHVIEEMYQENADILLGQQLIVTLDLRTSVICRGRSGAAWDMEGNPLPDSPYQHKFPGPPPYHWNCRSVLIPITKSWEQLIKDAGRKRKKVLRTVPDSKRSSMDGQVAGDLTYEEWLRRRSAADQISVLGRGRWELWKEGKLTLAQMIDQSGRPLTLAELRRKAAR